MNINQDFMEIYRKWVNKKDLKQGLKIELEAIKEKPEEIKERFYQTIEFGTAGLRGILGAGTNRMNLYTVRRAAQGFAQAINLYADGEKKIVIAYDSRRMSKEFAMESAKIFALNNIKTYLFQEVTPTPILSYAVRFLNCAGGIMITASHNPKNYNGYKVYWSDGAQVTEEKAGLIIEEVNKIENYLDIEPEPLEKCLEKGMVQYIYDEVYESYYKEIRNLDYMKSGKKKISILFSPFFGTAKKAINRVMSDYEFINYHILEEQMEPDSEFPGLDYPNPEDPKSFKVLLEKAALNKPELLMATDPDGDRIGAQVLHQNEYRVLTGNQMGILMVDYLLNHSEIPEKGYIVKTVVTADLAARIAEAKNIKVYEVLTGFKYIAELAKSLEKEGYNYLFGYEESYGYMPRLFVRDKDAVQAILLLAQIADNLRGQGKTLIDRLEEIYEEYGYFDEENISQNYEGLTGKEKMQKIMSFMRSDFIKKTSLNIVKIQDFLESVEINLDKNEKQKIELPSSNVMKFFLSGGSWVAIRPSGTEPKIKYYFSVRGKSKEEANKTMKKFQNEFFHILEKEI